MFLKFLFIKGSTFFQKKGADIKVTCWAILKKHGIKLKLLGGRSVQKTKQKTINATPWGHLLMLDTKNSIGLNSGEREYFTNHIIDLTLIYVLLYNTSHKHL